MMATLISVMRLYEERFAMWWEILRGLVERIFCEVGCYATGGCT